MSAEQIPAADYRLPIPTHISEVAAVLRGSAAYWLELAESSSPASNRLWQILEPGLAAEVLGNFEPGVAREGAREWLSMGLALAAGALMAPSLHNLADAIDSQLELELEAMAEADATPPHGIPRPTTITLEIPPIGSRWRIFGTIIAEIRSTDIGLLELEYASNNGPSTHRVPIVQFLAIGERVADDTELSGMPTSEISPESLGLIAEPRPNRETRRQAARSHRRGGK